MLTYCNFISKQLTLNYDHKKFLEFIETLINLVGVTTKILGLKILVKGELMVWTVLVRLGLMLVQYRYIPYQKILNTLRVKQLLNMVL